MKERGPRAYNEELRREAVRLAESGSKKRVARVMRQAGIRALAPKRSRVTTQSGHRAPVAPNRLARRFGVSAQRGPDTVWAADLGTSPRARAGSTWR